MLTSEKTHFGRNLNAIHSSTSNKTQRQQTIVRPFGPQALNINYETWALGLAGLGNALGLSQSTHWLAHYSNNDETGFFSTNNTHRAIPERVLLIACHKTLAQNWENKPPLSWSVLLIATIHRWKSNPGPGILWHSTTTPHTFHQSGPHHPIPCTQKDPPSAP